MSRTGVRRTVGALLAAAAAWMSLHVAQGATVSIDSRITRTMATAGGLFGGCMAALEVAPSESGLNCPAGNKWVTFSCTGEHATKADATRMYDAAQLAFVTGRRVRVWVDDERKHNGNCFVSRIQVLDT